MRGTSQITQPRGWQRSLKRIYKDSAVRNVNVVVCFRRDELKNALMLITRFVRRCNDAAVGCSGRGMEKKESEFTFHGTGATRKVQRETQQAL